MLRQAPPCQAEGSTAALIVGEIPLIVGVPAQISGEATLITIAAHCPPLPSLPTPLPHPKARAPPAVVSTLANHLRPARRPERGRRCSGLPAEAQRRPGSPTTRHQLGAAAPSAMRSPDRNFPPPSGGISVCRTATRSIQ
jgi:hypothetical protein